MKYKIYKKSSLLCAKGKGVAYHYVLVIYSKFLPHVFASIFHLVSDHRGLYQ